MTETRESPRRRAVTVAGLACLAAGLLLMVWLPWPPFSYLLLFLAALVCGAITIARRRVWPGLALILLTIAAPPALLFLGIAGPQVADTAFRPPIEKPAYPPGQGPTVLIDEAHANFHTASGRYLPFAELLRRDGYVVKPSATQIAATTLRAARVLVIANATASKVMAIDWLTLLVQNEQGYLNLMRLVSRAHLEFKSGSVAALPLTDQG